MTDMHRGARSAPKCTCPFNQPLVNRIRIIYDGFSDNSNGFKSKNMALTYMNAMKNIAKYPLPIQNGEQAKRDIKYVGATVASSINKILKELGLYVDGSNNPTGSANASVMNVIDTTPIKARGKRKQSSKTTTSSSSGTHSSASTTQSTKKNKKAKGMSTIDELEQWLNEHMEKRSNSSQSIITASSSSSSGSTTKLKSSLSDPACVSSAHSNRNVPNIKKTTSLPNHSSSSDTTSALPQASTSDGSSRQRRSSKYMPRYRSGGFAILVALYKHYTDSNAIDLVDAQLSQNDIKMTAADYCDASFERSSENYFSAWSSMKTLQSKDLVTYCTKNRSRMFYLTRTGLSVTKEILEKYYPEGFEGCSGSLTTEAVGEEEKMGTSGDMIDIDTDNDIKAIATESGKSKSRGSTRKRFASLFDPEAIETQKTHVQKSEDLKSVSRKSECVDKSRPSTSRSRSMESDPSSTPVPHDPQAHQTFESLVYSTNDPHFLSRHEIILLLDVRENVVTSNASGMKLAEAMMKLGVKSECRALSVGDMIWIARRIDDGVEFVLDCIIERKIISDLVRSITDSRYREQRYRIKSTGAQRRIYLIEGKWTERSLYPLPEETVVKVLTSLDCAHGFLVYRSNGQEDSTRFLANMHQGLRKTYDTSQRFLGTFNEFQEKFKKGGKETLSLFFGTQLRMINGVSGKKAWAIISKYPTLYNLLLAYRSCESQKEEELLLKDLEFDNTKVGPQCSRNIYTFFRCTGSYPNIS